jgi:hypothetical protein
VSSDGRSFSHLGFHIGTDWRAVCHTYDDRAPILAVDAGTCSVSFYLADSGTDKAAVEFARALVREAQAFAAEVERLSAGETEVGNDGNGKAADVTAA